MTWIAAGTAVFSAGVGIYKSAHAAKQGKKDAAAAAALKNPFYKIQDEYFQNKNIAAEEAQQGLPTDTKNYLTTEGERGLGTSISAINAGGGSPNDISRVFSNYQGSIAATGAQDAQAHIQNIQYYMAANKDLAGQKTTQWAVNEKQPYESKLKEITQRRAADAQNVNDGVNTAVGSLAAGVTGTQNAKLLSLLAAKKTAASDPFQPNYTQPVTADVGAGRAGSPAAGVQSINPGSGTQFNLPAWSGGDDEEISDLE